MLGESPTSRKLVVTLVPTCVPFRYTLYPVTPMLSVEAVQVTLIETEELPVAETPVGTLGGLPSPALVVAVAAGEDCAELFPAAS